MTRFKQPVSMKMTREQFERDLKQPLIDLGYEIKDLEEFNTSSFLSTNYMSIANWVSNLSSSSSSRHLIPIYNPQLFLALTAMTDSEDGIPGEYWKCLDGKGWIGYFTNDKLYLQTEDRQSYIGLISNRVSTISIKDNKKDFIKATKEEIISHFTKKLMSLLKYKK